MQKQELIVQIVVALIETGKFDRAADQRTNIKRAVDLADEIVKEADKRRESLLNESEQKIINCFLKAWVKNEMRICSGISYQMVLDLLARLGVACDSIEEILENYDQ